MAVGLAVAAATGAVWWRDRPLAEIARRLEEPGGALPALHAAEAFLARHPAHERGLPLKGRALSDLGRWDEANDIFAQVGADSSAELRAWAAALVNRRRWSEAIPVLERLLEQDPCDAAALRQITACQYQLGLTRSALASAARLAALGGHEVEGIFLSGIIHRARGDTNLALEHWERIERLRPDASGLSIAPADFFFINGEDLLAAGLPFLASLKLERSRELQDSLTVQLRLGHAHATCGNVAEANAAWQQALLYDSGNVEARQGLAELALARSDGEQALQWLAPLGSRPDVSSRTAYLLERVHTLLGNESDLEYWQRQAAALHEGEKREAALRRRLHRGL